MSKTRPVNLNLFTIRFPITAISSIFHRVTGLFLFLLLPFGLYYFEQSLSSEATFDHLKSMLTSGCVKTIVWFSLSALIFHVVAGVRHLFMDAGIGEEKGSACRTAWAVIAVSAVLIGLLGWMMFL